MKFDDLLSSWLPTADAPRVAPPESAAAPLLNPALQAFVRRIFESGRPPEWLRPLLSVPGWQQVLAPPPCDLSAALTRTEALASTGHKRRRQLRRQLPVRTLHWVPDASGSAATVAREHALTELDPHMDAVVFHPPGVEPLAFRRHQFAALAGALRSSAEAAARVIRQQNATAMLRGAGALDDCLALTLFPVDPRLATIDAGELRVVPLSTELRGNSVPGRTLREICAQLADRDDLDGIAVDPPCLFSSSSAPTGICWGPMFARQVLAGTDARRVHAACTARNLKAIAMADSFGLPGRFGRVFAPDRKRAAIVREMAGELLAALGPTDRLQREHIASAQGAAALRRYPHCGERRWLLGFIDRCQRVERTRWRVGLF